MTVRLTALPAAAPCRPAGTDWLWAARAAAPPGPAAPRQQTTETETPPATGLQLTAAGTVGTVRQAGAARRGKESLIAQQYRAEN